MLTKKKKIIVLVSMVALLVITGVLNIILNNTASTTPTNSDYDYSSESFFETSRLDRTNTRNEAIDRFEQIIASSSSSAEAKEQAEADLAEVLDSMLIESDMEGLIKAKGFNDVFVNYSSTYINVMVKSAELTEPEVAQIVEIIQGKTGGRDIDYIKIIPVA